MKERLHVCQEEGLGFFERFFEGMGVGRLHVRASRGSLSCPQMGVFWGNFEKILSDMK